MKNSLKNEKITRKERWAMIVGIWQAIFPMVALMGTLYLIGFIIICIWLLD